MKLKTWWRKLFYLLLFFMILPSQTISAATADLTIHQQFEGQAIEGAVYQLWQVTPADVSALDELNQLSMAQLSDKFTQTSQTSPTDQQGLTHITLDQGYYYVRQVHDQILSVTPFIVDMTKGDQTIYPKGNLARGQVKLVKVDNKGEKLQGVVFRLYREGNAEPERVKESSWTTDQDGLVDLTTDDQGQIHITNLPYGTYLFREIKPLEGYQFEQADTKFEVKDQPVIELTVVNYPTDKGGKRFIKVDNQQPRTVLPGAVFEVRQLVDGKYVPVTKDGSVYRVTSNDQGMFEVVDLVYGDYALFEIKAPLVNGITYKPIEGPIPFTIDGLSYYDGTQLAIINEPTPPEITTEVSTTGPNVPPVSPPNQPGLPQTGETNNYLVIGLAVLAGVAGIIMIMKRQKHNK